VDDDSGAVVTLTLESPKEACGSCWDLNSGQASGWGREHSVVLRVAESGNNPLSASHTYRRPGSSPLRWAPPLGVGLALQTLAIEVLYSR
jgi:hypothetical protein